MKSIVFFAAIGLTLCLFSCDATRKLATEKKEFWECKGNEPYWSIQMEPATITFAEMGKEKVFFPYKDAEIQGDLTVFKTFIQEGRSSSRLIISIKEETCMDAMSGESFPYSVKVEKDGETLTGCAK